MGKPKLAGSVRRYVATKLSRVSKRITGSCQSNTEHQVSTAQPDSHSSLLAPSVQVLPVTKIPALDTVDRYAADEPIVDLEDSVGKSPRVKLSCSSDVRNVIGNLLRGYACFIAAFTGFEDVAFLSNRSPPFAESKPSRSLVIASVASGDSQSKVDLLEVDAKTHDQDEVQFYAEIGFGVSSENGWRTSTAGFKTAFTLFVETNLGDNVIQISFTYPKCRIPGPAVDQLLNTLSFYIAESSSLLTVASPKPALSVLNFPPSMTPPTTQNEAVDNRTLNSYLLHAAFEGWARRKPHAVALDFVHSLQSEASPADHSILTYAALDTAASNLAVRIRSLISHRGRTPRHGCIIPVNMSASVELYISYLGILKAGHAFCPVPQDAPAQRVQEILHDIGSPIILGNTPEPPSKFLEYEQTLTWINVTEVSKWRELRGESALPMAPPQGLLEGVPIKKEQTAYLLYTSGSTGKPKGVQVSHLSSACSIASHATAIPLPGKSPGDFRWFQFASPSFDPSLMEVFVTLSSGATLCSADRKLTLANLEETINETKATVMMATPSLASLLRPDRLETLEALWSMGEKLNRTVIDNFTQVPRTDDIPSSSTSRNASRMLVNAYGPTEGAINCTFLAPFQNHMRGSIIGEALPTCSMFVLCPNTQSPKPVPTGTVGELAIGGPQVSKGYLNRPDETAKAFVQDDKFGYIYRTGDRARIVWDETGSQVIEYLGRISTDQVKVNGRRVELGEIESVIATVPGISEVVAVVRDRGGNPGGSEQIVACIVAGDTTDSGKKKIVNQARKSAAQYLIPSMCPSTYFFLDTLPRSSSGKVDRGTISIQLQQKRPDTNAADGQSNAAGVWGSTKDQDLLSKQQLVLRLLSETTDEDVAGIEPSTDLYTLGMDSLGAIRFLQKLRDNGIGGLSVSDVLQSQTSQALVSLIQRNRASQGARSDGSRGTSPADSLRSILASFSNRNRELCVKRLEIPENSITEVLPTTSTQSGMLTSFLRSSTDDCSTKRPYIYHSVLPLESHVNLSGLKQAWQRVVASYDSFRTVFCLVDDDTAPFAQCILKPGSVSKTGWDVYSLPKEGVSEETFLDDILRKAEESIGLSRPPWKLSLMESPTCSMLILSMFHGIFDGGSLDLLLEDVASVYFGSPFPQRISLGHVVKHHFRTDHERTSRFWREHLQGYSPAPFPSITPYRTPTSKSTGCVEVSSYLTHDLLKKCSRNLGSTPLSVLQAAWGALLLSYTGASDQDIVMGSVISGRLDEESQACIGPTFTITPLRISIQRMGRDNGNGVTNQSVIRHLTSFNARALSHLQSRFGPASVTGGQIPYDTVLAYQDFGSNPKFSRIWGPVYHPPMANDFSVMVEVVPEPDSSLTLRATFDTKLDSTAAEIMLKQMDNIIRYILEKPDGIFEEGSSHIRSDLKSIFNPRPLVSPDVEELLHSKFEKHAVSHPDDPALIFKQDLDKDETPGNICWTYGELNAMADNLASYLLQDCGRLTNTSVPICIEKSPALYVAILGILKAGGAWCPIDTLSPTQRRHDLIARTNAGILLVSSLDGAQPESAVPAGVKSIDVCRFIATSSPGQLRQPKKHRAGPNNVAYLIWTSGTTGAPKGVPITHSAAVSSMRSLQSEIPGNPDGTPVRCLQFSQCTFDVSIQDIFYTWGVGGVLIAGTREIMLDSFSRLANITAATHAHLTPAFAASVRRKSCRTLKVVTMIGEKLTQVVADDWGTNMRAFNTYGPAEATVVSTIREFGNENKLIKSANIGWPMKSVSVFVMKKQRVVMKNAIGELALGGPQLSPGYLNQKDVTEAKYVWNEEAGQRLYYTGDLVRMLSDGSLEYITRVDDLVKLGGIRIELSEITFALRGAHPLVDTIETLVLSRPDRPTDVVIAFICAPKAAGAVPGGQLLLLHDLAVVIAQAVSSQARKALPENMVPSVYLVVRAIPKTPSAKVDRRALQAVYASVDLDDWEGKVNPEDSGSDLEDDLDPSIATQIMQTVASLVNIDSSAIVKSNRLRSLGVDSLRATRLTFRLREGGYNLSVVDVLGCATIHDLVKLARFSATSGIVCSRRFDPESFDRIWHEAVSAKVSDQFKAVRATAVQESLLTETMGTYNMYWSNHFFKLDRSVDLSRLKQAWFAVCQKTEALRTGFIPVAEIRNHMTSEALNFSIIQLIYGLPSLDWEYCKCSEQECAELCENRVEDVMKWHQKNYFRHPPWAVTIHDLGNERIMILSIHHSVHDKPSLRFIMDDVRSAYTYKPSLRGQLSHGLSIILDDENKYVEAQKFWKRELQKFGELDVPVWPDLSGKRLPHHVSPEYRLISEEIRMTKSVTELQSAAANMGLHSIASIVRTAWAYVSLSYLGLPATVFAETLSDRVFDPSLENTVGPFISVVPIPFLPKGSAQDVLMEQHRLSVQARKYRHIHAREIRKALNRPRGEPLYPAVFNFHAATESPDNRYLPDLWLELEDRIGLHVEHPMAMNVFQRSADEITLEASSDSRLFSPEHLRLFVRQVDGLISSIISFPDETFQALVNRLPSDLRSLSNRPVSEEVADAVYQAPTYWLEKNAESHPDWTAVEVASSITADGIEKKAMSYATLNAEGNKVAAYLAAFGYKNRIVGVCCGRTLASYPIIVGIFKSGNTYLPIDESLPAERKAFLLEDGESPIVFTETPLSGSFSGAPSSCRVECIDDPELQNKIAKMPDGNRDYLSQPDDNSYLLFTSGSTGKPKGVMVTRANLSSFIESISEFACQIAPATLELGGTGRYLAQANRAFDPHLLEMFFPWRHGMATVTAPRPLILDDIGITLSKWDITHASFVPSLVDQSNVTPEQCPKLRFMTVGGEKITQKVLDTWASAPNVAIVNAYGPTEVTIGCTFAHINNFTNLRNIGPPLTACVGHVLIPGTMNYALRGQTGELCFSGDLVGKGYLNRPDAVGFLTTPDGKKMYRTGDMGRMMADESVEYLGRGDDQTKIRGQRLELGEVSEVIRACSPVAIDVVTTVAKHPSLAKVQLLSFISRTQRGKAKNSSITFLYSDFSTLARELQEICRRKLPSYMVPELILPISAIPVAPTSGKVNIKELHRLFSELPLQTILRGNSPPGQGGVASQRQLNADEEAVVNEICRVISADPSSFGPLTNIFEIGLDSISAIGLSIRLRNIGYSATVALIMSNPVIEQLAHLPKAPSTENNAGLSKAQTKFKEIELQYRGTFSSVDQFRIAAVWPCLPLQEGLVARSINSEKDQLYVNHVTLQLRDTIDGDRLKLAWKLLTSDNEILRTLFASLDKGIVQVVVSETSHQIQWTETESSCLEEAITEYNSQRLQISQEMIANISSLPPIRFKFARSSIGGRPLALFIAIHHALYDGESFAMMLRDVATRYERKEVPKRGSPSVFLEHIYLQSTENAKHHWVEYMSGCNPTILRRNTNTVKKTLSVHRDLKIHLTELEARSASLQTTMPNLLQAMFALLLADSVGRSDITYGLVLSGRTVSAPGAESVLLPCITTIPGRLNTKGLSTATDVVGIVQRATVRSLDFQYTSLRKIQQWLKSETAIFDCLFSFTRTATPPGHDLWKVLDSHMSSEYPLALEVRADPLTNAVQIDCIFSPDFGSQRDVEVFLEKIEAVLSAVVSGEHVPLESFNLAHSEVSEPRMSSRQWDNSTWSSTETRIRELTSSFCGLDSEGISKEASFLSLGIDSVTAIQFARTLRKEGLRASSSDVLQFSCVGALAEHLDDKPALQANGVNRERGSISVSTYGKYVPLISDKDSVSSMFECTPLQSGMITQTISSGGKVYVNPHAVCLDSFVDIDRLKDALHQVIQNNDILRTSFHLIDDIGGSWVGAVHTEASLGWKEISLAPDANVASETTSLCSFGQLMSFEIPPLRAVLVHQSERIILVFVMHHALYDGASLPFLFEDLATIYHGRTPAERPQFADIVPYILEEQENSCEFWTNLLHGYQGSEIPLLKSPSSPNRMLAAEHRVSVDPVRISECCRKLAVTVQTVSLLAFAKAYACLLGRRDVVFGQVFAGRTLPHPEADRTLGPLFNTVAQRVTLEPKFLSNRVLLQRLQQQSSDAHIHQHAPLRLVQNRVRQAGQLGSAQLCDSLFVFQKSAALQDSTPDILDVWTPYDAGKYVVDAEHKLNVEVDHTNNGVLVTATCNDHYMDQEMLKKFISDFDTVFLDLIEHPTRCSTAVPEELGMLPLSPPSIKSQEPLSEEQGKPAHEALIRSVLAGIAGVPLEQVKPATSIFNLGLDSLSAIRIASTCRGKGLKIGVGDILQGKTLHGISQCVKPLASPSSPTRGALHKDYDRIAAEVLETLRLEKEEVETILPTLPGQFYHLASWKKSGRRLLEPAWAFFCRERISSGKLQKAWQKLRKRHPVLRTVFSSRSSSEVLQIVVKDAADNSDTFKIVESSDNVTELAKVQAHQETLHPSSLFTPPVRLRLLKAADKDGILIIINHALYDAWAMPMLVSDLGKLYAGQPLDTNPNFPAFVESSIRSLAQLDEKAYWTSALNPGSATLIQGTKGNSDDNEQLFVGAWEKIKNLSQLEITCRLSGLSLQTIVLLAVARHIARITRVTSPIVGLYQTGRSAAFDNIEKLSGPCLNVTPFAVPNALPESDTEDESILEKAQKIQTSLAERVSYEQSSLHDILQWMNSENHNTPLFNIWINLLWLQNAIPSDSNKESGPSDYKEDREGSTELFQPLHIGVPTDFIPAEPLPTTSTSIDGLDTSFLPDQNVFIDIAPDPKTDSIGFGVRVEGGALDDEEVGDLVDGIVSEIEFVISCLR